MIALKFFNLLKVSQKGLEMHEEAVGHFRKKKKKEKKTITHQNINIRY